MRAHADRDRSAIGRATSDADGAAAGGRMAGDRAAPVVVWDGAGGDRFGGGSV